MDRTRIIEQVGHFLRNELSREETTKVKDLIANNKDYKEIYNELKGLQLGLRAEDLDRKLDLLKGLEADAGSQEEEEEENSGTITQKPKKENKLLKALLGFVLGLGLVYGLTKYYDSSQKTFNKQMPQMAENFGQYVVHQQVRSTTSELSKEQEKAYNLYVIQQFDQATPLLEELWKTNKDETAYYYLGIAYWHQGQKEKAREILSNPLFNSYKKPY